MSTRAHLSLVQDMLPRAGLAVVMCNTMALCWLGAHGVLLAVDAQGGVLRERG